MDSPAREIVIFANPIAGRGRGRVIARRLERRLRADGYAVRTLLQLPSELEVADLSPTAHAAIVIGGDGTIRAVAGQFIELKTAPPPILAVPLGTANLLGRHLGIRWRRDTLIDRVADAIARRRITHLDAGRANGALFLLMVGVGFDAKVVHEMGRLRTGPIGYASYIVPAAMALGFYEFAPLRVVVDGVEIFPLGPAVAFAGNVSEYGIGFPVLPRARPDDGVLDVCVLPCASHADLARLALLAAAGEHLHDEGAVYLTGKHIRIESSRSVPVQADGDPAGQTPVEIDLLPVRLPFIVP